jgi:hypothetical protein
MIALVFLVALGLTVIAIWGELLGLLQVLLFF